MASEYTRPVVRGHEFYLHLHELQPPTPHYMPYDISQANATPVFELTTGGACAPVGPGASHITLQPMQASHHQNDPRKRKNSHYTDGSDMSGCDSQLQPPTTPCAVVSAPRKRKSSSVGTGSAFDDDVLDDSKSMRSVPGKKQNHSEIEKRRRDKMNTYIMELSSMVPMCGAMARKLDKLTVLRMAVQYLRSIRGALSAGPLTARPRPAFLSERELNSLVLQAANDCFLLVVGCDRGRLLYVSASVKQMLHYEQSELLGQSLFDILHPKDVAKVKEQLSSPDLSPRERLIDAKTMLPVKTDVVAGTSRLCPGARRSFFCRIKCKLSPDASAPESIPVKEESEPSSKVKRKQTNEKKYCVVQCTGYLKSWAPAELSECGMSSPEGADDGDASNMSCLVAVVRALPDLVPEPFPCDPDPPTRHLQYVSRHAPDGKFLFVDQRVTLALGFLPQELLGTSLYEYVSGPELGAVAQTHKSALLQRDALHTPAYSFRRKDGTLARIQTYFKPFKNPWTKDVECLVAQNTVSESPSLAESETEQTSFDMFKQSKYLVLLSKDRRDVPPSLVLFKRPEPPPVIRPPPISPGLEPGSLEEVPPIDLLAAGDVASAVSEGDVEMQRLIDSQVESHKIGSAIAEEALRRASSELATDMPVDLLQDAVFNQQASLADNILGVELNNFSQVRNNVPLSSAGPESSPPHPEPTDNIPQTNTPPVSPPLPTLGLDGNGEAAMAVIMSLLEADAGLGGPVNFSGLPWPLP